MAARKTSPKTPVKAPAPTEQTADICRACWPDGWPHQSHSAECEHGTYARDPEPATVPQDPPPAPEGDGGQSPQDPETPPTDPTGD